MRQKSATPNSPSERPVKSIRRATRRQYSAEKKIRIVLDGLRGESSIAELCRREPPEAHNHDDQRVLTDAGHRRRSRSSV
jgi:transposase